MPEWLRVPQRCEEVTEIGERGSGRTAQVCVGTFIFHLRDRGACMLTLGWAMGNVTPSFTSRLLQEGVAPGYEEILKWAFIFM